MTDSGRILREIPERTGEIRRPLDGLSDAEGRYARVRTALVCPANRH